jgi:hypothetical protein
MPVLAQPMAVQVVALAAEEEAGALVELLSRQSFSAAMARSTT